MKTPRMAPENMMWFIVEGFRIWGRNVQGFGSKQ